MVYFVFLLLWHITDQKQLAAKNGFILLTLHIIQHWGEQHQGLKQEPKAGAEAEATEESFFLSCSSACSQPAFSYRTRIQVQDTLKRNVIPPFNKLTSNIQLNDYRKRFMLMKCVKLYFHSLGLMVCVCVYVCFLHI